MSKSKATHETDRKTIRQFEQIINVGKATAGDFKTLGFENPQELIGQDPWILYCRLCKLTQQKHDPCVLDVLMATIDFMNGNPPRVWWDFTEERKSKYAECYETLEN